MIIHKKKDIKNLQIGYTCESKLQGRNPKGNIIFTNDKHVRYNPITRMVYLMNKLTNYKWFTVH